MAISTEASRSTYTGNGVTTVFSTGFYFLDETEVAVKLTPSGGSESVKTLGVDYTVTMPAAVGDPGSITMLTPPDVDAAIVIERDVPFTQETSFRSAGTFSREVHEDAMDEVVFQTQQLDRRVKDLESAGAPGAVVAGNGLYFSGATLHAGAGAGIQANADDIAVKFGTAPSSVYVGGNYAGVNNEASRSDHGHSVTTAAPAAGAVVVGNAAAIGVSTALARADHVHAVVAGSPVAVDAGANVTGATGQFSDAGHKHTVSTAAAVELTDATNAAGAATTLARSDHTHSHGARGGGLLHAVATTAAAGFMSAADKVKLDGLAAETVSVGTVTTTDATPTQVLSFAPTNQSAEVVDLFIVGKKKALANTGGYHRQFTVRRHDGTTALVSTVDPIGSDKEDTAGWDVSVSVSSPNVIITVTGAAGDTVNWVARARRLTVDAA